MSYNMSTEDFDIDAWLNTEGLVEEDTPRVEGDSEVAKNEAASSDATNPTHNVSSHVNPPLYPSPLPFLESQFPCTFQYRPMHRCSGFDGLVQSPYDVASYGTSTSASHTMVPQQQGVVCGGVMVGHGGQEYIAGPSSSRKENIAPTSSPLTVARAEASGSRVTTVKRKASDREDDITGPVAGPSSFSPNASQSQGMGQTAIAPKRVKRPRRTNAELANEKTEIAANKCGFDFGRCEHTLSDQVRENRLHLRTEHYPVRHGRNGVAKTRSGDPSNSDASSSRSSSVTSAASVAQDGRAGSEPKDADIFLICAHGTPACGRKFAALQELQKHTESVHWKQRFQCDICGSVLTRRDTLLNRRGGKSCLRKAEEKDAEAT
ncbi:hypothetical protein PYCCODRAFT_1473389 [Trametes coccinea BRFM310]|uniref:C2H2-type domain-containing protein n=1 Tax=Trametes coccinea (strain BRFM310) TaxID=1353009 RepID=A0A1Y2J2R0_TRAC3|nr:hypothetical protein PYCCODRAFT_1473389 [Trametes coccinea BRFM310]